jgi:PHD/YefM family antitoxin component YafN of YafNO toxin-antitoxin module
MQKLTITEARSRFMRLPDETASNEIIAITRRNKEIMALMSWEFYEGLLETIEILGDPELMRHVRKGMEQVKSGKTYTVKKARKRLGL